jgi:rhomboid family GlyGly-CTERM serine protease
MRISATEQQAFAGALVVCALQALAPQPPWLEYRHELLGAQPWRVFSAHFVHLNWEHAVVNVAAWIMVARLFSTELTSGRHLAVIAVSALGVSAWLAWIHPEIAWYRGLSGVLHGIFFAGAIAWTIAAMRLADKDKTSLFLSIALIAVGWAKVIAEQPAGSAMPYAEWLDAAIVPQAHLAGSIIGTALGAMIALPARPAQ